MEEKNIGEGLAEAWTWFALAITLILGRCAVRIRTIGFRKFQGDDYLACVLVLPWAAGISFISIAYRLGTNVDVTPANVDLLTDEDVARLRTGSQFQVGLWYAYTGLIWIMKFMLLFLYRRITTGTPQRRFIAPLFWLCGATYLAVFLTVTFGCYPMTMNWQVRPIAPPQCSFKPQNLIVTVALNVFTDVIFLIVPIPIIWKLQIPVWKKCMVGIVLCSGVLAIVAAIVRIVYTFSDSPSAITINNWGCRELFVITFAVNAAVLSPITRRNFWTFGKYQPGPSTGRSFQKSPYAKGSRDLDAYELKSETNSQAEHGLRDDLESHGSQETIIRQDIHGGKSNVTVNTSFHVESQFVGDGAKRYGRDSDITALHLK